jgi:ABC-2 type transport system permease protein
MNFINFKKLHLNAYMRVWLKLTAQQFEQQVANARGAAVVFIFGKLFRLATAFFTVYVVVGRAKLIAGYDLNQAIFILILFNLIQTITQLFLRGVYMFRQKVVDGDFDFYLLNPLNEIFYSLFSNTDPLDVIVSVPYIGLTLWAWHKTGVPITWVAVISLIVFIVVAFTMVVAWHIVVISIGIRYLEVDNTIMLYRDLERMAAFPTEMYGKVGNFILTYLAPFGLMATVPARYIFGLFQPAGLLLFAILAVVQLRLALRLWRRALLTYASASS